MGQISMFIGYDYDKDKHYKNLLTAWDKHDLFDFKFYDASVDVSVNSTNADYIKRVIRARIYEATHFLCIVGEETWKSDWVDWEIKKANEFNKRIISVKINSNYTSPTAIIGVGANWAKSFTFESIKDAIGV